jgi:hypothetical protein
VVDFSDEKGQPDTRPVLSASEIGQYAFCREAWYLARRGAPVLREQARHMQRGIDAHRQIGDRTDRILQMESVRFILGMARCSWSGSLP